MDGIIGLGYDQISGGKLPTFIESTTSLSEKSFSFYMKNNAEASYMVIPGINEKLGFTEIACRNVIEQTYLNFTRMTSPNSDVDFSGYKAAIDYSTIEHSLFQPLLK